jgi:hypothetical protein
MAAPWGIAMRTVTDGMIWLLPTSPDFAILFIKALL